MPLSVTDGARLMRRRGAEGGERERGEEGGGGADDAASVRLMSEPVVRNETGKNLCLDFLYLLLYFYFSLFAFVFVDFVLY